MTALDVAAKARKMESVRNMLAVQKERGISTDYVEGVVERMIKADEESLDTIEELVQHVTIEGNIDQMQSTRNEHLSHCRPWQDVDIGGSTIPASHHHDRHN